MNAKTAIASILVTLGVAVAMDPTADIVRLSAFPLAVPGSVKQTLITPDGTRVVYRANQEEYRQNELYSVRADGVGGIVKLNPPLSDPFEEVGWVLMSPDGAWIVFSQGDIYSVPVDGSLPARVLFSGGGGTTITADSAKVVIQSGHRLFVVPIDGGTPPVDLTPGFFVDSVDYEISPTSVGLVFRAFGTTNLYGVLFDVPTPVFLTAQSHGDFEISPDGRWVVFQPVTANGLEVWSLKLDLSSGPHRLNPPAQSDILDFTITGDSARVLFRARTNGVDEIFASPIDAAAPALAIGGDPNVFANPGPLVESSPDGIRAVFVASSAVPGVPAKYCTRVDGSATPFLIPTSSLDSVRFSPDSSYITYLDGSALASLRADGSQPPNVLLGATGPSAGVPLAFSDDGQTLLARVPPEIHAVPVDGSAPAVVVASSSSFVAPALGNDTLVFSWPANDTEVRTVPIDGSQPPLTLTEPFAEGLATDVRRFSISPDGKCVLYHLGEFGGDYWRRAFLTTAGGHGTPLQVGVNSRVDPDHTFSPDSTRLVYTTAQRSSRPNVLMCRELGTGTEVALSPDAPSHRVSDFKITPNSQGVVYRVEVDGTTDLMAVHIPTGTSVNLSELPWELDVDRYLVSPDNQSVAFTLDVSGVGHLYSRAIDGSQSTVSLATGANPSTSGPIGDLAITADSRYAVYGSRRPNGRWQAWSVPLAGTTAPIQLNDPLADGMNVTGVKIRGGSGWAVFRGDLTTDEQFDLYSRPVDGSGSVVMLSAHLHSAADVEEFALTPDGQQVVFRADPFTNDAHNLYVVPVQGGYPYRINPAMGTNDVAADWKLGDGFVVYQQAGALRFARLDGSSPQQISVGSVESFKVLEDGILFYDGTNIFRTGLEGDLGRRETHVAPPEEVMFDYGGHSGRSFFRIGAFGRRELFATKRMHVDTARTVPGNGGTFGAR